MDLETINNSQELLAILSKNDRAVSLLTSGDSSLRSHLNCSDETFEALKEFFVSDEPWKERSIRLYQAVSLCEWVPEFILCQAVKKIIRFTEPD